MQLTGSAIQELFRKQQPLLLRSELRGDGAPAIRSRERAQCAQDLQNALVVQLGFRVHGLVLHRCEL